MQMRILKLYRSIVDFPSYTKEKVAEPCAIPGSRSPFSAMLCCLCEKHKIVPGEMAFVSLKAWGEAAWESEVHLSPRCHWDLSIIRTS